MAVNYTNVTQGTTRGGWTAGSIAPRAPIAGPVANIGMSGNIPSNILQAIGNLNAEQAFRQFLGSQIFGQQPVQIAPPVAPSNPAAALQAQSQQAQQAAQQLAAQQAAQQLSLVNQNLSNFPTGFGGITPMGMGAPRAALQQQQFGLENRIGQLSGWNGTSFPTF